MAYMRQGGRELRRLGQEQDGRGLVCHPRLTTLTGWHRQHLGWHAYGSSDRAANRLWPPRPARHRSRATGWTWANCVLNRAFARLVRQAVNVVCAVLRGRGGSHPAGLPGGRRGTDIPTVIV